MNKLTMAGAALVGLAAVSSLSASAVEPKHLTEVGLCRVATGTGICSCSLSSIETQLSFGEAASTVELFYRGFPDESYVMLLISMLKQCSSELQSAPMPAPMRRNLTISAPAK